MAKNKSLELAKVIDAEADFLVKEAKRLKKLSIDILFGQVKSPKVIGDRMRLRSKPNSKYCATRTKVYNQIG